METKKNIEFTEEELYELASLMKSEVAALERMLKEEKFTDLRWCKEELAIKKNILSKLEN